NQINDMPSGKAVFEANTSDLPRLFYGIVFSIPGSENCLLLFAQFRWPSGVMKTVTT
ncbi:unnamed protein product, partial [marine sediment metagenome]